MQKNPGKLVETKSGKIGRTYNSRGAINGKVPVYLATSFFGDHENADIAKDISDNFPKIPRTFADAGILCDPATLKIIGFID